jgi:hypothetical protein
LAENSPPNLAGDEIGKRVLRRLAAIFHGFPGAYADRALDIEVTMTKLSHRITTDTVSAESKIVRTSGQIFADGAAIELVASAAGNRLDLLFLNRQKKIIAPQVTHSGLVYQAPNVHETLVRAIRFPRDAVDNGLPRMLFAEVLTLFQRYIGLASPEAALLTAWNFSTWFPDCVSSPPTLVISTPDSAHAITLFRLLAALCRRSLVVADINRAAFLSLMRLQPTLLIHEPRSPKIWDMWGSSNHRGVYLVGNAGQVYEVVGSKAVFSKAADTWSDEAIHLALPVPSEINRLEEHREAEIANLFQPRFLMHRLRNFSKVRQFRPESCKFEIPDSEIARSLIACIQAEPDIGQAIVPILLRQHRDAQARRGCEVGVVIVEVIWTPLHETREIAISRVAELTNALLRIRGGTLEYSPAEIGWKLKGLGLQRHRNGGGMVLQFSKENRLLIHQLAQRFGLKLRPTIGCPDCGEREVPAA